MTQLAGQTVKRLIQERGMITNALLVKTVINGKSAGLSGASYDARIAHDLTLGVNPAFIIAAHVRKHGFKKSRKLARKLRRNPPHYALAHTVENFKMPADVSAAVADKSTYARLFVSAFNTFFDPGFIGNATLELVNFESHPLVYTAGEPVCQFIFSRLNEPVETLYDGKYQHQKFEPTPAIFEADTSDAFMADCLREREPFGSVPRYERKRDEFYSQILADDRQRRHESDMAAAEIEEKRAEAARRFFTP